MTLSYVLKTRRKELGLTLLDIAKMVGVTEATVQRWESGNIKNLRHNRIVKLAEALEVQPSTLMGWDDLSEKKSPSIEDGARSEIEAILNRLEPEKLEKVLSLLNLMFSEPPENPQE